jgi:hypothetical protein
VLSGKRIERAERGEPGEFDRMSDEELRQAVLDHAEAIWSCAQEQNAALNVQFSRSQAIKFLEIICHVGFALLRY